MGTINSMMTSVFDATYGPMVRIHPALALTIVSGLFGVVALLVIRYCTNQAAIGRVKDAIKADILSIKLFRDELRVMFRAMPRILWSTAKLQLLLLPSLLVMVVPMALVCGQMAAWHEWRPLRVGEKALVTITLDRSAEVSALDMAPRAPEPVTWNHRVRSVPPRQVSWYVSASAPGRFELAFPTPGGDTVKELVVNDGYDRVSPLRHDGNWVDTLLYPRETPFDSKSAARAVAIHMPPLESWFYGSGMWVVWFLVLSIAIALIFKPILKVKF